MFSESCFRRRGAFWGPAEGDFWRNFLTRADKCFIIQVYYSNVRLFMLPVVYVTMINEAVVLLKRYWRS